MIRLIALKELRSLFHAPSTWYLLGGLQFMLALSFFGRLDEFLQIQSKLVLLANAPGATQAVIPYFFSIVALVMMMFTPVFTMRLLAEERRNQTLPLLLAAPFSSSAIVLGKFAGLAVFLWLIVLVCAAMTLTLALGTPMDFGLLAANACGMLLLSASYCALGLYISALTNQPLVAAIGAQAVLLGLWLAESTASDGSRFLHSIAPTGHFQSFNSGLLDSGDFVYFLLFCAFFLLLAIRRLDNNRIYG
ncbi:MAG TPA: ABC transporter permease subunit [Gallionellaceae bacterium]